MKKCQYGHLWYAGQTCPVCDLFGRDNLESAKEHNEEDAS